MERPPVRGRGGERCGYRDGRRDPSADSERAGSIGPTRPQERSKSSIPRPGDNRNRHDADGKQRNLEVETGEVCAPNHLVCPYWAFGLPRCGPTEGLVCCVCPMVLGLCQPSNETPFVNFEFASVPCESEPPPCRKDGRCYKGHTDHGQRPAGSCDAMLRRHNASLPPNDQAVRRPPRIPDPTCSFGGTVL